MDLILLIACFLCTITVPFVIGRRVIRYARQVPPAPLGLPDIAVLRRRFVRVVFGLAVLTGLANLVVGACTDQRGFSRGILVMWPWVALATAIAACVAPLVVRGVRGDAWATSSTVLPVTGLALSLPLTLHAVVFCGMHESWTSFDDWCGASLIAAGFAHLVFAALLCVRTLSLARSGRSPVSVYELFTFTTLAAAVPGVIFGMGITAVTGLPILPVIWGVGWLARREHAATSSGLPRAIVSPCRA